MNDKFSARLLGVAASMNKIKSQGGVYVMHKLCCEVVSSIKCIEMVKNHCDLSCEDEGRVCTNLQITSTFSCSSVLMRTNEQTDTIRPASLWLKSF